MKKDQKTAVPVRLVREGGPDTLYFSGVPADIGTLRVCFLRPQNGLYLPAGYAELPIPAGRGAHSFLDMADSNQRSCR